jgi:hypothetical protein
MVLNLTRSNELAELMRVNNELRTQFDNELQRLKEEERALQDALKLKTRYELINTMEKELEVGNLSVAGGGLDDVGNLRASLASSSLPYHQSSTGYLKSSTLNQSVGASGNLDDVIQLSNESLLKSSLVMDKLTNDMTHKHSANQFECSICSTPGNHLTTLSQHGNKSSVDTNEFLKQTAFQTINNRRPPSRGDYTIGGYVAPNIVNCGLSLLVLN